MAGVSPGEASRERDSDRDAASGTVAVSRWEGTRVLGNFPGNFMSNVIRYGSRAAEAQMEAQMKKKHVCYYNAPQSLWIRTRNGWITVPWSEGEKAQYEQEVLGRAAVTPATQV